MVSSYMTTVLGPVIGLFLFSFWLMDCPHSPYRLLAIKISYFQVFQHPDMVLNAGGIMG